MAITPMLPEINPILNRSLEFTNITTKTDTHITYDPNVSKANDISVMNDALFHDTLIPTMIYLVILLASGLPGNLLVCYIYPNIHYNTKQTQGRPTLGSSTIFILTLAWLDVLNCLISLPIEMLLIRNFLRFDHPWICKLSRYFVMVMNCASSFTLLGIAIDRFVGINCQQSRHRFTATTAKKIVICAVTFAIISSTPALILYGTQTIDMGGGIHGKTCLIADAFVNTSYPFIHTIYLLSTHILGDVFFISMYGYIGWTVIRHRKHYGARHYEQSADTKQNWKLHKKDVNENIKSVENTFARSKTIISTITENEKNFSSKCESLSKTYTDINRNSEKSDIAVHGKVFKPRKTTFMLFIVTVVFMLNFVPYCVIAVVRNVCSVDFYDSLSNTEKAVYHVFLRSYLMSSSVNPIIYSFLSFKFRQQCKILYYKWFRFQIN